MGAVLSHLGLSALSLPKEIHQIPMEPRVYSGLRSRTVWSSALMLLLAFASITRAQSGKNILILFEGNADHPANMMVYDVFRNAFASDQRNQTFVEYIDEDRLGPSDDILEETFRSKYAGTKMDLVVGDGRPVLKFLVQRGERIWPGVPKVFYFVERRELPPTLPPNMTGVAMSLDFGAILDLALQLKPETKRAFYVGGVNGWEQAWRSIAEQDFKRFRGRVEITYLNDLPFAEMLDRLGRLPDHSVVIYSELLRDISGHVYVPARACPLVASASNAPVYGPFDIYIGCGVVGGVTYDDKNVAEQTAALGLRVLQRGSASGIPVESTRARIVVDWRQLQRWKISEASLPPASIVQFRAPTLWEQYKPFLVAGLAAIFVQLTLIVILLAEMRRRKRADLAIRTLSGRIINATEEERKRIARELHDDIGQRLSLVSMGLDCLDSEVSPNNESTQRVLKESMEQLSELVHDVHNLSHQLHSSKLRVLGLEMALKEICRQLARQHKVCINFTADRVPSSLPEDLALCFFRVAQEGLNNCVKHSGSTSFDLELVARDATLRMTIKDYGVGFHSTGSTGIGLATMRERLRFVEGSLQVNSRPGKGTEVIAQAKWKPSLPEMPAAPASLQQM
ncbi:MAG: hypothetical protein C5B58_06310 [Acidobacteria bacterium]|nr:MAG: hypothetical protein C5B58_06310 [Acidobacteriota bacterium]